MKHRLVAEKLARAFSPEGLVAAISAVSGPSEDALLLLRLMADDSKWEVRKEVPDCLKIVPDDEFLGLAALLADDSNAFVRQAAERTLDRHRRGAEFSRFGSQHKNAPRRKKSPPAQVNVLSRRCALPH